MVIHIWMIGIPKIVHFSGKKIFQKDLLQPKS